MSYLLVHGFMIQSNQWGAPQIAVLIFIVVVAVLIAYIAYVTYTGKYDKVDFKEWFGGSATSTAGRVKNFDYF